MTIERLVFSGGSIKGIAYIGVIKYLEEINAISSVKEIIGCSVGSFTGLLLALGYKADDIKNIIFNINLENVKNFNIENFITNYGLDNCKKMEKMLKIFIKNKGLNEDITLKELYTLKGISLVTTVTNVNTKSTEFFTKDYPENCKVYDAVRASMSIPIIFSPFQNNDNFYVDGGLTCNFPIKYLTNHENKEKTLCFYLRGDTIKSNKKIENMEDYLYNIIKSSFSIINNIDIKLANELGYPIVEIHTNLKSGISFDLSNEMKQELHTLGYDTIKDFYDKKPK